MKKNKKKIIIALIIILVVGVITTLLLFLKGEDKYSLNLTENKWIDSNKYNVIDIGVINDIPVLSYEGSGFIYDYLDYVTSKLSLKFNEIPFKLDDKIEYSYKMDIVDNVKDSDIVLLKDNMILITKDSKKYMNFNDITNLKIGILKGTINEYQEYFKNNQLQFVEYDTYESLKKVMSETKTKYDTDKNTATDVDGIIIMKSLFTSEIIKEGYNISYQFDNLNKYVILDTKGDSSLNNILYKTYQSWKEDNYEDSYNENLLNLYIDLKEISDVDEKNLKSKSYKYGFINYGIYNYLDKNKISGLSGLVLKGFNKFSGLSITYTQYNSLNKLLNDYNSKKVDFIFSICNEDNYKNDVYKTISVFDKRLAVISGIDNKDIIDSIESLKNKEVLTIKDSYIEKYLIDNNVKVKSYNNMKDLVSDFNMDSISIVDLENYNYYKSSDFKDVKINYVFNIDDSYTYHINDTDSNKVFEDLFNFYLNYTSIGSLTTLNYNSVAYENSNFMYIIVIISIILAIYVVVDFFNHFKFMIKRVKKNKKVHLSKEEKIKYIDQLTSLKNRAYFNSRIESWDDSEIYPQAIIVIDLNNISYINDNYGREEGDKVITEAANILIMHQMQNSEIIRTDGNEFLIYLVGYSEKQIISYRRKLTKELKGLSHGFGAASGYSIINDAIKTIDDAVNEATLDMKNNKEDIDY